MINLKTNQLTKNLVSSAVAIGFFAGISIISAPAQAAMIVCTGIGGDCPSVALSQFIDMPGMSYKVGDKLFDNFRTFISIGSFDAVLNRIIAPTSSEIFVTGFQTAPNWYDLVFTTSKWQVNLGQSMDTSFRYDVTSLGTPITSVDLELLSHGVTGNGTINVTETVTLLNPGGTSVSLLAQSIPPGPVFVEKLLIPPQQKISVHKDVALNGNTGSASISVLGQSYHQRTPEPSSMLGLLAVGGLGLGLRRKQTKD